MLRFAIVAALVSSLAVGSTAFAADLTIGIAAPLAGPDAVYGAQIRLGVEQAVADLNAAGGFLSRRAAVVARDDGSEVKKAGDAAAAIIAAKATMVVGDLSSATTAGTAPVFAAAGLIQFSPSALAPALTDQGLPRFFRLSGREDEQADVAARYMLSRHVAKVALIYDNTADGKALADGVRRALERAGVRETVFAALDGDGHNIAALAVRIKAANTQITFFGGRATQAGQLARQLRDLGARTLLMGGASLASDEFASAAGTAADGTTIVFPLDPRARAPAADLLRRLRGRGIEPGALVFYAYAAVQAFKQSADAARSLDPAAIAAALHRGMPVKTVLGDISFDGKGDPHPSDWAIYVWHRGATGRMTFDDQVRL